MFWVYTVLVTAYPFSVHKDLSVMNRVIFAVKITAPSQARFTIRVTNDVFNFDATPATRFILSFLRW
jgi:hypothetical protein